MLYIIRRANRNIIEIVWIEENSEIKYQRVTDMKMDFTNKILNLFNSFIFHYPHFFALLKINVTFTRSDIIHVASAQIAGSKNDKV